MNTNDDAKTSCTNGDAAEGIRRTIHRLGGTCMVEFCFFCVFYGRSNLYVLAAVDSTRNNVQKCRVKVNSERNSHI